MIDFVKGHGTENDFVLISDLDDALDLTPELVRELCDRRRGVGADGVIRLVGSQHVPEGAAVLAQEPTAQWFMDYRNADGSIAEMCGNGVRVFGAFVEHLGLVHLGGGAELAIGTRAGVKRITREPEGWYVVDMGPWRFPGGDEALAQGYDAEVAVAGWTTPRPGLSVDLGNPHTVVALGHERELEELDLSAVPEVRPVPAAGTNVELVVPLGEVTTAQGVVGHLRMRVHERGVGETRSCGTGTCAAALAVRAWAGPGAPDTWLVDVPGGTVRVRALRGGHVELAGPAELVFAGKFDPVGPERRTVALWPPVAVSPGAPAAP